MLQQLGLRFEGLVVGVGMEIGMQRGVRGLIRRLNLAPLPLPTHHNHRLLGLAAHQVQNDTNDAAAA